MVIDALENESPLPEKSVLLTFDDAYSDHYTYVFPILDKKGIQGSFYPPAKAITQHKVLDVNKIHFILATESNKYKIIKEIKNEIKLHSDEYKLETFSFYFDKLAHSTRYDSKEINFIKLILQVELEESLRSKITNNLFEKIVGVEEHSFSRELYMNIEQLQCMHRHGMHIGSHGYDHYWLGRLNEESQKKEIEKSLDFLKSLGVNLNNWTMCYPYGSFNDTTINLLINYNCKLALTTEVNIANIGKNNRFILPRLDTNDLPKSTFSND
jgi:peptidoglycan/xylan/chitin deacetylase (PgdA/CDA1 family)